MHEAAAVVVVCIAGSKWGPWHTAWDRYMRDAFLFRLLSILEYGCNCST
jgi:hypothetical protein